MSVNENTVRETLLSLQRVPTVEHVVYCERGDLHETLRAFTESPLLEVRPILLAPSNELWTREAKARREAGQQHAPSVTVLELHALRGEMTEEEADAALVANAAGDEKKLASLRGLYQTGRMRGWSRDVAVARSQEHLAGEGKPWS